MRVEALRLDHIEKSIGAERVLSDITLCFFSRTLHAILMQNTNGRRALVDILSGNSAQDHGDFYLFDQPYQVQNPYYAKKRGIFCIGHKSHLVPELSIAENLFLMDQGKWCDFTNARKQNRAAAELLKKGRLEHITPKQSAGSLPDYEAHMIEILRAVSLDAKVIVFENVMDRYSETEMQQVLRLLSRLKDEGLCIILFSNKYGTPFDVADHASIVHNGVTVANYSKGAITRERLLRHFNAQVYQRTYMNTQTEKDTVLQLNEVTIAGLEKPITWSVRAREVTGVWEQEFVHSPVLVNALFGRADHTGEILLSGKRVQSHSYKAVLEQGLILIPERGQANYVFPNMGLEENLTLMMRSPLYRFGLRSERMQRFASQHALSALHYDELSQFINSKDTLPALRKHEQMQIAVAKWLCCRPKVMVFVNPFFCYDDLTMHELQKMIDHLCQEGIGVVVLSLNLRELEQISDRIYHFQDTLRILAE